MQAPQAPFILGWEEWVALPELRLPAIKAKVDTGARTSALHAYFVEPCGTGRKPMVRFGVHPIPRRSDVEVICTAAVVDRRHVASSNGERENRYVIATLLSIGSRQWPIEVTLTNRDTMSYRMLLGRQAITDGVLVDPGSSFCQPRLGYTLYTQQGR
jgi:ribosomal protein S6--L-glutamate ligase